MKKTCKYLLLVLLLSFFMSCSGKQIQYTKVVEGCLSKEEITILDTLFQNFVQKMNVYYDCKDADASLHYLVTEFYDIMESRILFSSNAEEKNLINKYRSLPTFKDSWMIFDTRKNDSDTLHHEYFLGRKLFDCIESNSSNKDLKQIFDNLKLIGDYSVYIMESAFRELLDQNKKIPNDIGFSIFSFCYMSQLLGQEELY